MKINNFKKKLICWGGGDQIIVLDPIIKELGSKIDMIIDDTIDLPSPLPNVPIVYGKTGLHSWLHGQNVNEIGFIIAIGNPYGFVRCYLHQYLVDLGLAAINLCDRSSVIDSNVILGDGCQIMRNAIVNSHAVIGAQCILNTRSLVEHHCQLGLGVEIGPAATLTGRVTVADHSWICAAATIIPRIKIGSNTIIGAGAVVTRNIPDKVVAAGVPARIIKHNTILTNTYE